MHVPGGWRTGAIAALVLVTVAAVVGVVLTGHHDGSAAAPPPVPRFSTGPTPVPATPALPPAGTPGTPPTAAGVEAALKSGLSDPALGSHVGAAVLDATSGASYLASNAAGGFAPASTTKLFTAAAALTVLGPDRRIVTKVVQGPTPASIVIVGGGDPTLALSQPAGFIPAPASLPALAAATAKALKAAGRTSVHLDYDTTLFTGPRTAPTWPPEYVTSGQVSPITALTVEEGRTGAMVEGSGDRVDDPPASAAKTFARLLGQDGITITGTAGSVTAGSTATQLAAVSSPAVSDLVQWMLTTSDNDLAEALAHLTGLVAGDGASFAGGVAAVTNAMSTLGVPTSTLHLYDGSGLTSTTAAPPSSLAQLLQLASSAGHPTLRSLVTGLAVAGFNGSLEDRFTIAGSRSAAGMVLAKTGTLTGVSALAGVVDDADGRVLVFVFLADQVPSGGTLAARDALDRLAADVSACGCRA